MLTNVLLCRGLQSPPGGTCSRQEGTADHTSCISRHRPPQVRWLPLADPKKNPQYGHATERLSKKCEAEDFDVPELKRLFRQMGFRLSARRQFSQPKYLHTKQPTVSESQQPVWPRWISGRDSNGLSTSQPWGPVNGDKNNMMHDERLF